MGLFSKANTSGTRVVRVIKKLEDVLADYSMLGDRERDEVARWFPYKILSNLSTRWSQSAKANHKANHKANRTPRSSPNRAGIPSRYNASIQDSGRRSPTRNNSAWGNSNRSSNRSSNNSSRSRNNASHVLSARYPRSMHLD
jgi:hypothetical protein